MSMRQKLPKLWPFLVKLHQEHPDTFSNPELLKATAAQKWPQLKQDEKCPNCDAHMKETIRTFGYYNALLMLEMANVVRRRVRDGVPFTKANRVHVVQEPNLSDTAKHQTTVCRYLGLIAKVKNEEGKHDTGMWLITKRGWAALRGEPIPSTVSTFRNEITKHHEATTTIGEALRARKDSFVFHLCVAVERYNEKEWYEFGDNVEGAL